MSTLFDSAWEESIRQVSSASFSMEESTASQYGFIDPAVLSNLDVITEILGSSEAAGDGKIKRALPLAHPEYPFLHAQNFTNEGLAFSEKAEADTSYEAEPIAYFAKYQRYRLRIDYKARPYVLMGDESIPTASIDYYETDGTSAIAEVPYEWWRYTDFEYLPAAEYLTASQGTFTFDRSDLVAPNGATIPGEIRILQKKKTIKFRWFQVPLSYVESESSYIDAAQGSVNQLDWYNWGKGTLLYLSYTYKRYTPPNPGTDPWAEGVIANTKLVDIEFTFLYFDPGTLTGGSAPSAPSNGSHITAGHNLLPYMAGGDGGYYYAKGGAEVDNAPVYPSFPFQLLFKDPDAT